MGNKQHFDAVVIGAGFGGIYMLHKLRNELGLNVQAFEKGGGVGGTWYFNRYPGAKSDTEGFVYRYSFDKDLLQEWDWKHTLPRPARRRELPRTTSSTATTCAGTSSSNTEVTSAVFDETATFGSWHEHRRGDHEPVPRDGARPAGEDQHPRHPGRDTFAGTLVHTDAWPEDLDLTGKRVGVIGTGSTGTQFIIAAAKMAEHLTVFQRSPQYCVPSGNGPVGRPRSPHQEDFDAIWDQVRNSVVAFGFEESSVEAMSVSEAERRRVFQENWEKGNGFRFMFGTFCDIATNPEANEAAAAFIRSKIAEIVKDPETARKLTPTDLYAKRPLCDEGYYETFNRDNVTLVSIKENPIEQITPAGVVTADGVEHELDVLVFATGFDAVDGNYRSMDLRGRGGQHINEHWTDGPTSYLGLSTPASRTCS